MKLMLTIALTYIIAVTLSLAFIASANAQRTPTRYAATLRCAHIAEDSAAHVRLVEYTPHADGTITLVYRCERYGY